MQWFVFFQDRLLLKKEHYGKGDAACRIPLREELPEGVELEGEALEMVLPTGEEARVCGISHPIADDEEWQMTGLRASFDVLPTGSYQAAGKSYQILYWDRHSRFCPVCGSQTVKQALIMKKCPACGNELYPPISTAIIVLIRKGKEILLVHARNFRGTFYGLVAGFLEPGETLEECVQREVMEETGLQVTNIRYFSSQPWPYPSGLMVGFTADYASGDIRLQEDELTAGAFFTKENLPEIPRKLSIARKLIDWWLENES